MKYKISIIIATYNADKYIQRAITSVLNQCLENYECIVVDGMSTDKTLSIIESYIQENSHIRLISEKDNGIFDAYNKGWKAAKGEWIYYLGADDVLLSNGLNDLLEEANGYDIIYGKPIDQLEKKQYHPKSKSYRIVKHLMFCCHQALIIKRDVIKSLGGFNINYLLCADFDLIQRAYLSGYKFKQISCDVCVFSLAGVSNKSLYGTDKEVRRISINNGCYKYISLVQMYYLIRKTVKYLLLKFHII